MTVHIVRGDARKLPLADESVDLILTSPPYWSLRAYTDGGEAYDGQIGSEDTPAAYIDNLIACTREWVRVLKPTGSIFVNLGDKYGRGTRTTNVAHTGTHANGRAGYSTATRTGYDKSLMGLPWRYALRCIDTTAGVPVAVVRQILGDVEAGLMTFADARTLVGEYDHGGGNAGLGLILRAEIIWSKCLSGGARLYARTPTGDRPIMIRDLFRAYRPEDVQVWNGQRWTQIVGWERTADDDGALELEFRTGERVGCTVNHRWPTSRGVLRADEIQVGDVIESTRLPQPDQPRTPTLLPDDDIGWLIGLYLAEGSRSETTVQIAGHVKEDLRHTRLARIAAALDATCNIYQTSENGSTCNLRGSVLSGVIDRYVSPGTAKTKRLRHAAWQRSDTFLAAVVEGYLSGDGHYDAKNDRWRLGFTANDEWAADLRTLAARLGAKLSLRRCDHMMSGRKFPGWRGEWRWTRSAHHNATVDGEVVAIRRSRARDFYDIEVADDPHLFALASGILTHNSNGLPESVVDRVRRSHEQWFHLTKQPRYYSAIDHIRQPQDPANIAHHAKYRGRYGRADDAQPNGKTGHDTNFAYNPLGALPGSVWEVATEPLIVPKHLGIDHFAAYPTALIKPIILGWSPSGICTACCEGRRPVTEKGEHRMAGHGGNYAATPYGAGNHGTGASSLRTIADRTITGEVCGCPDTTAPTRPALVLDPFSGTGTTSLVASALGRDAVGVDMSEDYCRLARWRTSDPGQIAKVLGVAKPPVQLAGQTDLLAELDGGAA